MEKAAEMMTEYILERMTGLETENRHLTERNDALFDTLTQDAKALAKLAEIINPRIEWKNEKAYSLHIYADEGLPELIKILRIERHDKAIL